MDEVNLININVSHDGMFHIQVTGECLKGNGKAAINVHTHDAGFIFKLLAYAAQEAIEGFAEKYPQKLLPFTERNCPWKRVCEDGEQCPRACVECPCSEKDGVSTKVVPMVKGVA